MVSKLNDDPGELTNILAKTHLDSAGPNAEERVLPGTGALVVLKVYDLLRLSPLTTYQLEREVRLHSSVKHENIVNLIAAFTQSDFRILVQSYAHGVR